MRTLYRMTIRLTAAIAIAGAMAGAIAVPSGRAAVPPDIASRIEQAAASWQQNVRSQRQLAGQAGDSHLADVGMTLNSQVSASLITQAVMDALGRNPADARETISLAVRAAPALAPLIKQNLASAYPALAGTIAAAGTAQPIARRAPPPPTPQRPVAKARPDPRDPLEGVNRAVFGFNDFLDSYLLGPTAHAYRWIMPATIRGMVRHFFRNFNEPVVAINDVFQGDFGDAGESVSRFAINSTIGILGFFDVAKRVDLPPRPADFGQTLNDYGVGAGPYLVLPVFGRTTARDAVGEGVDFFLNPLSYFFLDWDQRIYMKAGEGFANYENRLDETEALRKTPPDYYSASRNAWFANRARELRKQPPPPRDPRDDTK